MLETIAVIVVILLVLVAVMLAYAATKPDTFRVERAMTIKAPPEKIHPLLNDLRSHMSWSPWEQKDPAMKRTYSGPASGKGATYEWAGNRNIGSGRMEITATSPHNVTMNLDFFKPFKANNIAGFTLEPKGHSTNVTWFIYGPSLFISKLMSMVCNMDRMIGKEFETGLSNLKTLTEK